MSDTPEHIRELVDDEESEFDAADHQRFIEAQIRIAAGQKGTPMEDVLAEFGLAPSNFPLNK